MEKTPQYKVIVSGRARQMLAGLVDNLKTPDVRENAIEQCDVRENAIEQCVELKKELEKAKTGSSKKRRWDHSEYEQERKLNNLVQMLFRIHMEQRENEEAISYFKRGYIERDQEVSLFILLDLLGEYDLKDYWIREYDEAMKRGIEPRESLQRMYMYIQEKDEIPGCMI